MAKKKRKWLRLVIPLVLIAAAVVFFMSRPGSGPRYAEAIASTGNISTTYSFTGNITAPQMQTLTTSANATVRDIYVSANETVKSGDRIVRLSDGTTIKADIDGEVVRLNVQKDSAVTSGSTLATIMDVTQLEVEISIDEYDVAAIAIGKEVEVKVNALGITCPGTVASFDKNATTNGTLSTYAAVVAMEAPEGVLPGMQVEVKMLDQSAENVTLLSVDALQFDAQNRAYVLTRSSNGEYVETYVQTGINDGSSVEITSGLASGTTVYYTAALSMDMAMPMMGGERMGQ
ncbi:MAG: HlyD family efflux transporter periplasmic adaptor subunit [Candidatus Limiplasma sp.]|nr:HlyD family efflux transporter periplasmic adaptor subunit [Candidatus Limiplasma sp.]